MDDKQIATLEKETALQKAAFEEYYRLKGERSYAKIAIKFKKAVSTVEKWGKIYQWQDRVNRLDSEVRNKEAERALIEQEHDYLQRNIKITKIAILKHAEAIKLGKMKPSYSHLIDLITLEHRLRTGHDSNVNININLSSLDNSELLKRITDLSNSVQSLSNMKTFEEDVEDADFIEVQSSDNTNLNSEDRDEE